MKEAPSDATRPNTLNVAHELRKLQVRQRYLSIYCGLATAAVIAMVLTGASSIRNASFDVITAQRINIEEPDGTLRLAISNRTQFPGAFVQGTEIVEHRRPMAGMLFLNDEGTESGGLIFNGALGKDGKPDSGLSLTFDRYQQDQQLQLLGLDGPDGSLAALQLSDVADGLKRPIFSDEDERLHKQGHAAVTPRVFLGKTEARDALLQLLDAQGKPRLQLQVTPEGEAKLAFLDEKGAVLRIISATATGL